MHCTGYLFGNGSSINLRVSFFVYCRTWRRITLLATVSWLLFPDPCGPRSDSSAMYHVRAALSVTDPSLPPARAHGTSCRSATRHCAIADYFQRTKTYLNSVAFWDHGAFVTFIIYLRRLQFTHLLTYLLNGLTVANQPSISQGCRDVKAVL